MTPTGGGRITSLTITLGIFLKLLGFFVLMFTYAEFEPVKIHQAEYSLRQRFNISIPLADVRTGQDPLNVALIQGSGRSFDDLENDLKTEMDFLSVRRSMNAEEMKLRLSADQILDINGTAAKSQNFAESFTEVLKKNQPKGAAFEVDAIVMGPNSDMLMRAMGDFVQKMVIAGTPQKNLTIGYSDSGTNNMVELRIRAVAK